ncbi:MAG: hypothetical protein LBV19_05590 [Streptococcaceae bacterium]|nr:hypothetical protein [Streptococcaceae bacterium]
MDGLIILVIIIIVFWIFFNWFTGFDSKAKQKGEKLLVQNMSKMYIEKMLPHIEARLKEDPNGGVTFVLNISDERILAEIKQEVKRRYPNVTIKIESDDSAEIDGIVNNFRQIELGESADDGIPEDIIYREYYMDKNNKNK